VQPKYFQRQGIGKKLVEAAENGLQKLGCPKVNLQLRYSNFIAQHFYRKIGYGEDAALSFGKRLVFDSAESTTHGGSGTGGFVIRDKLKPGDLGGINPTLWTDYSSKIWISPSESIAAKLRQSGRQ
jgi:hypothetical protein